MRPPGGSLASGFGTMFLTLALSLLISYVLMTVFHLPIFFLGAVLPLFWLGRRR